mgnify:CR=1 FL=1
MLRILLGFSMTLAAATCVSPSIKDRGVLTQGNDGPGAAAPSPKSGDKEKVRLEF